MRDPLPAAELGIRSRGLHGPATDLRRTASQTAQPGRIAWRLRRCRRLSTTRYSHRASGWSGVGFVPDDVVQMAAGGLIHLQFLGMAQKWPGGAQLLPTWPWCRSHPWLRRRVGAPARIG